MSWCFNLSLTAAGFDKILINSDESSFQQQRCCQFYRPAMDRASAEFLLPATINLPIQQRAHRPLSNWTANLRPVGVSQWARRYGRHTVQTHFDYNHPVLVLLNIQHAVYSLQKSIRSHCIVRVSNSHSGVSWRNLGILSACIVSLVTIRCMWQRQHNFEKHFSEHFDASRCSYN